MKTTRIGLMLAVVGLVGAVVAVQPEGAQPGDVLLSTVPPSFPGEHKMLAELVGSYNTKVLVYGGKESPTAEIAGAAVRRSTLGGRFMQEQLDASNAASPFALETTIGFNPDGKDGQKWELMRLSSAAFPMMVERGTFDSSEKLFTFKGEHRADGKIVKTRSVMRMESHRNHLLEVFVAYEDGSGKVTTPEFKAYAIEYERSR
jgi:hypothetical protein